MADFFWGNFETRNHGRVSIQHRGSAGDKRRRQAQEGREQKTFKKKKKYLYTWNTVQRVETHQNTVVQRVQPAGQTIFKSNQK